jgi:hypothetical protein
MLDGIPAHFSCTVRYILLFVFLVMDKVRQTWSISVLIVITKAN